MKSPYTLYFRGIEMIESGQMQRASELIRTLRGTGSVQNDMTREMKTLLSTRIALRAHPEKFPIALNDIDSFTEVYLKADALSLLGGVYYSNSDFERGLHYFEKAEHLYRSQKKQERALLMAFNAWIGNLSVISLETNSDTLTEDNLAQYRTLAQRAFLLKDFRIEGLLKRQFSIHHLSLGRNRAALLCANESESLLSRFGCVGDAKIAILLQVEALSELGDTQNALAKLESLGGQSDARSAFPIYYLQKKLGLTSEMKSPKRFSICNPLWKRRWDKFSSLDKDISNKYALGLRKLEILQTATVCPDIVHSFKAGSLERAVIEGLTQKKLSKAELIERLWPECAGTEVLDNRFYRLMNRVKSKCITVSTQTQINYDGSHYYLEKTLRN